MAHVKLADIFTDPITRTEPEGKAILKRKTGVFPMEFDGRRLEHWEVRFVKDPPDQVVARWVDTKDVYRDIILDPEEFAKKLI